jgi:hypothetical protein
MIYFIECDAQGTIWHIQSNPFATIVPLINIGAIKGVTLTDPVGVSAATYNMILAGGISNFTYDSATQTVVSKVAPSA